MAGPHGTVGQPRNVACEGAYKDLAKQDFLTSRGLT